MSDKITISLNDPTGDFWVDNGLVKLADLMGEGTFEINEIMEKIINNLVKKTGNKGIYYSYNEDNEKWEETEYDKKNWVYPTNKFISVSGRFEKKEINGKKRNVSPPAYNLSLKPKGKHICDICGKESPADKSKQWMYPFVVTSSKFSNFYSNLKGNVWLCPRCALSGVAGYLSWMFCIRSKKYMHIFLFHDNNLNELLDFQNEILSGIQKSMSYEGKSRNFPMVFHGEYVHETTMGLILKLFSYLDSPETSLPDDLIEKLFEPASTHELKLYAISGTPTNNSFNMEMITSFNKLSYMYRLYKRWLEVLTTKYSTENQINLLNRIFRQFYKKEGKNYNTLWREKISHDILNFQDPFKHIESFLYDARAKESENDRWPLSKGTEDIFEKYAMEVLKMNKELLKDLKGFGHALGNKAAREDKMGLLYSLRNAKNIDEFLRVLNDINFKLEMTINEKFLQLDGEKIMDAPWIRVKTILSIYAMNSYLWNKKSKKDMED